MKGYALDASAVVDYVQSGPGSDKIEQLLADAFRQQLLLYISVLNLGEVFYLTWQRTGEQSARQTVAKLSRLPVQIIAVDLSQALRAGQLKALHNIPYVDCIAAAVAMERNATLVTADRHFEKLGRHFPILWLARP